MCLVYNNDFEGFPSKNTGKPGGNIIRQDIDTALRIEFVLGTCENLDVFLSQESQPIHIFVSPVEPQRARTDYHDRPVFSIQVTYADRLDGLSNPHFVSNKDSTMLVNTILNADFLKVIKVVLETLWQMSNTRLVV